MIWGIFQVNGVAACNWHIHLLFCLLAQTFIVLRVSPILTHFCNFHSWIPAPFILSSELDYILFPRLTPYLEIMKYSLGQIFPLHFQYQSPLWCLDYEERMPHTSSVNRGIHWYNGLIQLSGPGCIDRPQQLWAAFSSGASTYPCQWAQEHHFMSTWGCQSLSS